MKHSDPTLAPTPKAQVRISVQHLQEQREAEAEALERERKSPYKRWYQINAERTPELDLLLRHCPQGYRILLFIWDQMDGYNALIASYKIFQEALGISRPTVARSISYLKEHGWLHVKKSGTANVYLANSQVVWKSYGKNLQYCDFPGKIMIAESEQEQQAEPEKVPAKKAKTRTARSRKVAMAQV